MLSTDENIFTAGSEVQQRMTDYGSLVTELHIIVKAANKQQATSISGNVFIYPAGSYIEFFKVGKKIISQFLQTSTSGWLVTSQDPFELGFIGYLLKKKSVR